MKKITKNKLKSFLAIMLILPFSIFFTACSNGKSAYELACENGFNGSVQEWLDSLKGKDGTNGANGKDSVSESTYDMWQLAVDNGDFIGTYPEFLETYFSNNNDITIAANKAMASVVEINAGSTGGSGIIYSIDNDNNAFIITNYHVVYGSSNIYAKLFDTKDNQRFSVSLVGASATYDIAILYASNCEILETNHAKAVTFDIEDVVAGENCFAIGNTNLEGLSVTKGCVSVVSEDRTITSANVTTLHRVMRHSAYISFGNSGGGLFNNEGELIGITNSGLKATSSTTNALVNFAIPSSIVYSISNNIISNCFNVSNEKAMQCHFGITFNITTIRKENLINHTVNTNDKMTVGTVNNNSPFFSSISSGDELISIKVTTPNEIITKNINRDFNYYDLTLLMTQNCSVELTLKRPGEANNIVVSANYEDFQLTNIL